MAAHDAPGGLTMHDTAPTRHGRWWLWPDGTRLPVVAGAAPDDPDDPADPDPPDPDDPDDPADPDPDDPDDPDADPDLDDLKPLSTEGLSGAALSAVRKRNKELASLRRRLKEQEPLVTKARELEDGKKGDVQRLTDERDSHKSRADTAEAEVARLRVALRKGLNETQAKRLVGDTEEELEQDADELLESFKADDSTEDRKPRRRPKEDLRPGAVDDAKPEETDPAKLAAKVPRSGF